MEWGSTTGKSMFIKLIRWLEGDGWGWEDSKGVRRTTWREGMGRSAGKGCRRNKAIIAYPYCLSRITCKYFSCSEMETSRLSPSSERRWGCETSKREVEVKDRTLETEGCGTRKSLSELSCRPPAEVLLDNAFSLIEGHRSCL